MSAPKVGTQEDQTSMEESKRIAFANNPSSAPTPVDRLTETHPCPDRNHEVANGDNWHQANSGSANRRRMQSDRPGLMNKVRMNRQPHSHGWQKKDKVMNNGNSSRGKLEICGMKPIVCSMRSWKSWSTMAGTQCKLKIVIPAIGWGTSSTSSGSLNKITQN